MADVSKLLVVLHALVDTGNSMVIIEHNLDVIKNGDWVIDMGPEGGAGGGQIVAEGTPEQITKVKDSYTGQFLKKML
jgi:excinuclease ABC subunit A